MAGDYLGLVMGADRGVVDVSTVRRVQRRLAFGRGGMPTFGGAIYVADLGWSVPVTGRAAVRAVLAAARALEASDRDCCAVVMEFDKNGRPAEHGPMWCEVER